MRSRGMQPFWPMHVEAINWSGMGVREYAAVVQLSPSSLRKWRDRLDSSERSITDQRGAGRDVLKHALGARLRG